MRYVYIVFLCHIGLLEVNSQPESWQQLNYPYNQNGYIFQSQYLHSSSSLEALFINGKITYGSYVDTTNNFDAEGTHWYPYYQSGIWSYLNDCPNSPYMNSQAMCDFNDGFVTSGSICITEDELIEGLVSYSPTQGWQSLGTPNAQVHLLKVINNELYATGWFTVIGEDSVQWVAKYNGQNWVSAFSTYPEFNNNSAFIYTLDYFNDEWYIGGNWIASEGRDLLVFRDGIWQEVVGEDGALISGAQGSVRCSAIFQGELYVGGGFIKTEGNVGHGIQKWDGTNWHEVGGSVQSFSQLMSLTTNMRHILVDGDYLYAFGGFFYAGFTPMSWMARWDGTQWCGMQTETIEWPILLAAVHEGKVCITSTFENTPGTFMHDGVTFGPCSEPVTVESKQTTYLDLHPNPSSNTVYLSSPDLTPGCFVRVYNLSGQMVYTQNVLEQSERLAIATSNIGPPGMYVVQLHSPGKAMAAQKLVVAE